MSNSIEQALRVVQSLNGDFTPGNYWTHYKGGVYQLVEVAVNENTSEPMVVYRSLKNRNVWVRPLSNWTEDVQLPTGTVKRFKLGAP